MFVAESGKTVVQDEVRENKTATAADDKNEVGTCKEKLKKEDEANSQENLTVVFKYAPNQLYKIYCRADYLTGLSSKKGEKVTFVGGGDTSAWAVEKTTVDGVPHIYIKPTVATNTTNLIITTNKRSYQLILNTSSWYTPMVTWSYEQEEQSAIICAKNRAR